MAAWDYTKHLVVYTTNQGASALFRLSGSYHSQAATLGNTDAAAPFPQPLRRGVKPRVAIVKTAGGVKRRVVIFTKAAFNALVPGTTSINVNVASVETAATVQTLEGERYHGAGLTG